MALRTAPPRPRQAGSSRRSRAAAAVAAFAVASGGALAEAAPTAEPHDVEVVSADGATTSTAPRVLERFEPQYPPARLLEEHGPDKPLPELDVELEVELDAAGNVRTLRVIASGGPDFDAEAIAAVKRWRFAPAEERGQRVASRFHVPVHFEPPPHPEPPPTEVTVSGRRGAPSRGASDHRIEVGALARIPRRNAAELLKLAPSVFLLRDGGGEGHADRVYLRGFDAREGQDIEFSVGGVPMNDAGNFHGNGYADLNFVIPELVTNLRVLEGPFDPRQGNFAVAGSAEYELGVDDRGLTAKASAGSFDTQRLLVVFAPDGESRRTFAAADVFRTGGFGQNRDALRARAMGQYEGRLGDHASFRLATAAYVAEYHSAGLLRADDVEAGRVDFYDTYDPRQGGSAARYHLALDVETRRGDTAWGVQGYGVYRSMRLRENYTGFLLDTQLARQEPHGQRGDLLDLAMTAGTFGSRGFGRQGFSLFGQKHEVELGAVARADLVSNQQQRLGDATGAPYATEAHLDAKLADVGLYGDLSLKLASFLALRGGVRANLFAYDVDDLCAVRDVSRPSDTLPPGDASCLSQQRFGRYRDPNQRSSTASLRAMPRVALLAGPWDGVRFSMAYGQGVRSVDPSYISQDVATPFATVDAGELGASYGHSFDAGALTAESVLFVTHVGRDQLFSPTEGRATLSEGTTRVGWSGSARFVGEHFDESLSVSLVRSRFDDTGLLVPYVPDAVVRNDGALVADLFDLDDAPVRGRLGLGTTFVGRRALPFGQRSDVILTLDAAGSLDWRGLELELTATNLLDQRFKQAEFNYVSDFDPRSPATLVPARMFAAGQPLGVFVSLAGTLGGPT